MTVTVTHLPLICELLEHDLWNFQWNVNMWLFSWPRREITVKWHETEGCFYFVWFFILVLNASDKTKSQGNHDKMTHATNTNETRDMDMSPHLPDTLKNE